MNDNPKQNSILNIDSEGVTDINEIPISESEDMKISICSTPTRHMKINELNDGEILQKIDALNYQYDKRENESISDITKTDNSFKNENLLNSEEILNSNYLEDKMILEKDPISLSKEQTIQLSNNFEDDSECININEALLKELKRGNFKQISIEPKKQSEIEDNFDNDKKLNHDKNENGRKASSSNTNSSKISEFEVINQDHYLKPFESKIRERLNLMNNLLKEIEKNEFSLYDFSHGFRKMGFNITEEGLVFREYAPGAKSMSLFGEFNNWKRNEYNLTREEYGYWSIKFPIKDTNDLPIKHNTKIKLHLTLANGRCEDRNPVWCKYLIQNKESHLFDGVFWQPKNPYKFQNLPPNLPTSLRIYEAHVGMSSIDPKVNSYRDFADNVLPRIKESGYTAVQLMAIMEHAYYGSFGYHVTNFYAISSRSGDPDDLKYLIDKAHGLGLYVLLDLIHSHASSNVLDGLNNFDGTDYLYFHGGEKGYHKLWDSRLFNYRNWETLRLLFSNLTFYMKEYRFDGFRFDGITSMLYNNHGINYSFSGRYNDYFSSNVDLDACVYLMIANKLIKMINPYAITIAEDVSGMPTLCRPIEEGGFGFDYRLNMSIPDKWIELLKECSDENWNMGNIVFTLTNRRYNEKHIGYCESHDQSIVGDKTISMWLFGKEIYHNMDISKNSIVMDRGMALHKMIRLITYSLGGEAYLNFMGNEFGHPEWVDFPRKENGYSYHYCRRRWDLCDNPILRYKYLYNFDKLMHKLESDYSWFTSKHQYISLLEEKDKIISYEKGELLFIFNFHPTKSFEHYRIGTKWTSPHKILLDTDEPEFGGYDRLRYGHNNFFPTIKERWTNRPNYIQLYIPSRTAMVLIAEENIKYTTFDDHITENEIV